MNQFEADAASRMGIVRTACAAARTAVALHAAAADPLLIGRAIREARDLLDQLV